MLHDSARRRVARREVWGLPFVWGEIHPTWVFIKGGCSWRGVQWMGVVLYSKTAYHITTTTTPCFHCTPPLRNVEFIWGEIHPSAANTIRVSWSRNPLLLDSLADSALALVFAISLNSPEETPDPRRDSKKTGRSHTSKTIIHMASPCFLGVSSWV